MNLQTKKEISKKKIHGDPGKQATGWGVLLKGLRGMVRGRQDSVQDEQKYGPGLQDREGIRCQEKDGGTV